MIQKPSPDEGQKANRLTDHRILSLFTDKTIPQETRAATTSYNLIRGIRIHPLRYLSSHILRSDTNRLVYQTVVDQRDMNIYGGLAMDTDQAVIGGIEPIENADKR